MYFHTSQISCIFVLSESGYCHLFSKAICCGDCRTRALSRNRSILRKNAMTHPDHYLMWWKRILVRFNFKPLCQIVTISPLIYMLLRVKSQREGGNKVWTWVICIILPGFTTQSQFSFFSPVLSNIALTTNGHLPPIDWVLASYWGIRWAMNGKPLRKF